MFKHVDGGKAAVCRFELDPRRAHESPAYALKKGLPLTFCAFFSLEASGELGTGMSELGVAILDFHDAQSVDCRLECTIVDKRGKVVYKSVCEHWTFERATKERWSVRVAPTRLAVERKGERLFADFRVEWKPPDWRKEERVPRGASSGLILAFQFSFPSCLGLLRLFLVSEFRRGESSSRDAGIEAIKRACADETAAMASLIFAVEEEDDELIHALSFLWDEQSKAAALLNSPQLMDLLAARPAFSATIYDVIFPQ
ncbi:hypothetical protein M3Y99_01487800 [Aphelenchoides fujianensis]|nr:hypothetical protein M3Y99_01487800 [Aphelenchoides fujianensis]